jgi:hypothetical protein
MQSQGRPAFCPKCGTEYTFFEDSRASDKAFVSASDGRLARPCFACSFRTSRWDVLWVPLFLLVAGTFPLFWMIWSNLIGPFVFMAPTVVALWRRLQRVLGRAPEHSSVRPR